MLNFQAPINFTSYGITGYSISEGLTNIGISFSLFPLGSDKTLDIEKRTPRAFIVKAIERAHFYDKSLPSIRLWHQFNLAEFVGVGPRVGFPIFELDRFNKIETHHLSNVDALFVPSHWAKNIIEQNNIQVPTFVVPLGVDRKVFYERPIKRTGPYTFLNIGKLEIRKGHDILCELFNRAFEPEDDVQLVVSCFNMHLDKTAYESWMSMYKNSKLGDKIRFVDRQPTQSDVATLISGAHCLIQPSRAEGWNLPLLEAMSCNRPTITTNYSAHTEFCDSSNSFLVDITETESAYDGRYFFGQGNWAKIDEEQIDQFVEHMRYCFQNQIIDNQKGLETAKKFSWNNSAQKIMTNLELLR